VIARRDDPSGLAELRKARGWSLRQLSERTGWRITHAHLATWEQPGYLLQLPQKDVRERITWIARALADGDPALVRAYPGVADVVEALAADLGESLGLARPERMEEARRLVEGPMSKLLGRDTAELARACGCSPATVRDTALLRGFRPSRNAGAVLALAGEAGVSPPLLAEALGVAPAEAREAARWRLIRLAATLAGCKAPAPAASTTSSTPE
jgi:transcriptional regulator with XRE-family HTH domain